MLAHLGSEYGYFGYPSRGSRGIDAICLAPNDSNLPHLGLEIGGSGKRVRSAFEKIHGCSQFPGMALLVVREVKVKGRNVFRWYANEKAHYSVLAAIAEWREL